MDRRFGAGVGSMFMGGNEEGTLPMRIKNVIISLAAAVFISSLLISILMAGEARTGISRYMTPSPDNQWLASVAEHWDNGKRIRTLTVRNLDVGVSAPLTLEYLEVVESPNPSVIAYIAKDSEKWYGVYMYGELYVDDPRLGQKRLLTDPYPIASLDTSAIKTQLQFSTDGEYVRFLKKPYKSIGLSEYGYRTIDGEWGVHQTDEDFKHLEWHPPKEPKNLPSFITAPQPRIHEGTAPVWSHDSRMVYVHDEEGIWRVPILPFGMPEWSLFLPMKGVRAFQISSDGRWILVEIEEGSRLALIDLESDERKARDVGTGWGARFNPDGDRFAFANSSGAFIADVSGGKTRRVGNDAQPRFDPSARLQWSLDSQVLYTHDERGVWASVLNPEGQEWVLMVPMKNIRAFQIRHPDDALLVETDGPAVPEKVVGAGVQLQAPEEIEERNNNAFGSKPGIVNESQAKEERFIALFNLFHGEAVPIYIGRGWSAGFDGYGHRVFFANFSGLFIGDPAEGNMGRINFATRREY